jgi:hypothetical protein
VNNTMSTIVADTGLTPKEITTASRHLSVTRGFMLESVGALSPAQWNFKPVEDRWSIAEIVEHVVLVEGGVHKIIEGMSDASETAPAANRDEMEEFILTQIPKRTRKVQSPPSALPTGRWTGPEALEHFIHRRERSTRLLVTSRLRGHSFPHPLFGPWDGYQWLLACASHGARHTEQIREVKADANFPPIGA